jgi:hypothetical protein
MTQSKEAKEMQVCMDLFPERWDDNRERRDRYWRMLHRVRMEYFGIVKELGNDPNDGSFYIYIADTYGIKPILTDRGEITDQYEILDKKKQMMLILKHGS